MIASNLIDPPSYGQVMKATLQARRGPFMSGFDPSSTRSTKEIPFICVTEANTDDKADSDSNNEDTNSNNVPSKGTLHRRDGSTLNLVGNMQREIQMRKMPRSWFGADFVSVFGRIIVSFVHERLNMNDFTAAYRTGLGFGDEIISLNGEPLKNMNTKTVEEMLFLSSNPNLDICECSLGESLSIPLDSDGFLGISSYRNKKIEEVEVDSPAHKARITLGHTIVSLNGKCTVGLSDVEIQNLLDQASTPNSVISLKTMKTSEAVVLEEALRTACEDYYDDIVTPAQLVDMDFTGLMRYYHAKPEPNFV